MSVKYRDHIIVLILAVVCFLLFSNTLNNDFIFDDYHMIVENQYIRDLKGVWRFFYSDEITSVQIPKGMYRPLLMASFSINYLLGNLVSRSYHIINILIHFLNGVLLYIILILFLKNDTFWFALTSALLFVVHPVNTQAVNYISCRSTLLVSIFYLLSFYLYVKKDTMPPGERLRFYLGSLTMYLCALLTKENAITLPLLLLFYELFIIRKETKGKSIFQLSKGLLAFSLLTVGYIVWRTVLFGKPSVLYYHRPFSWNFFTQLKVAVFYLRLFLFPVELCLARHFPISTSFFELKVILSFLILLFLIFISILLSHRYKVVSLGLAWYLITLLPIAFISSFYLVASEHHIYLPAIGLFMILAFISHRAFFSKKCLKIFKFLLVILWVIILSFAAAFSYKRNTLWRDPILLWKDNIRVSPLSIEAHHNLGIEYDRKNYTDLAIKEFQETIRLDPKNFKAYYNLGIQYGKKGNFLSAIDEFKKTLVLKPDYPEAHYNLAISYLGLEPPDTERAKLHLRIAERLGYGTDYLLLEYLKKLDSDENRK